MLRLLSRIILSDTLPLSAVFPTLTQGQDSIRVLTIDEVTIMGDRTKKKVISIQILTDEKLQRFYVYLIADSAHHFFGTQIKNYGSISKLKTINIKINTLL